MRTITSLIPRFVYLPRLTGPQTAYRLAATGSFRTCPQRGIALITVMLAVALTASIVATLIADQQMDIRRSTNILHGGKAYEYARAVELWATRVLARDLMIEEAQIDHPGENWAMALPPTDIEGGALAGRIEDLQGRFNLNNLVPDDAGEDGQPNRNTGWRERLQRLLARCDLAPGLAGSIVDWLDADGERTYPQGAEDYDYLGREVPYRAANAPMADPSELAWVSGFAFDDYRCLAPFVTALPGFTPINVNTAPVAVLTALAAGITDGVAELLVERRSLAPYESVAGFLDALREMGVSVSGTGPDGLDETALAVGSRYYLVIADIRVGNIRMRLFSRLERRDDGSVRVLYRARGAL
uniref:Type II secretion system protein K n=1 Tax=Candidatus Kentrum sp. DK TaxID=2126562 RepID=A0A450SYG2_9GAMM|nr:MAG: general secretion pathway protein K [Candidatus Kentron sp. DK]